MSSPYQGEMLEYKRYTRADGSSYYVLMSDPIMWNYEYKHKTEQEKFWEEVEKS